MNNFIIITSLALVVELILFSRLYFPFIIVLLSIFLLSLKFNRYSIPLAISSLFIPMFLHNLIYFGLSLEVFLAIVCKKRD
ncbi:hypothetical protein [Acidianus manzaensis]|nr:hypothetical protein [Acidianus manzaensis]